MKKLTPEDFEITNYTWRDTDSGKVLDCHQDVDLSLKNLTELPFQFGIIDEVFDCSINKLISLKGCPEVVKGSFYCLNNKLTSLEFGPKEVKGKRYWCYHNKLITLRGAPINFKGGFYCGGNPLPEDENTYDKYIRKLKLQKILEIEY